MWQNHMNRQWCLEKKTIINNIDWSELFNEITYQKYTANQNGNCQLLKTSNWFGNLIFPQVYWKLTWMRTSLTWWDTTIHALTNICKGGVYNHNLITLVNIYSNSKASRILQQGSLLIDNHFQNEIQNKTITFTVH